SVLVTLKIESKCHVQSIANFCVEDALQWRRTETDLDTAPQMKRLIPVEPKDPHFVRGILLLAGLVCVASPRLLVPQRNQESVAENRCRPVCPSAYVRTLF